MAMECYICCSVGPFRARMRQAGFFFDIDHLIQTKRKIGIMNRQNPTVLIRRRKSIKFSLVQGIAVLGLTANAMAATCDSSLYVSQDNPTTLYYSSGSLPATFTSRGTATGTYNALGYNTTDNTLYAVANSSNTLVQVNDANGSTTSVGTVTGLPSGAYNAGAFDVSGNYYVKPFGATNIIYKIAVSATPSATAITLDTAITISDMAWSGSSMYATDDSGQLYSINVSTGAVAAIGSPDATGGVLGAQFSFTSGLFGLANNGSGIYQIDLTTGARTKVSDAPASGNNDGASCPNASFPGPAAPSAPAAVPTLGQWALMLLAGALSLLAWRKRFLG